MTDLLNKNPIVLWILTLCALAPWLIIQMNSSINGDTAWLLVAAQRLLDGGTFFHDVFELNPPLSVYIHYPAVWIASLTGAPLYYAVYAYFILLIAISATATHRLLQCYNFLNPEQRFFILLGFIIGATIIPSVSFGEREHLVFLGLFPFVLVQHALTNGISIPSRLKWPVLIVGSIAIVLKPHFGILPTILLLHRAIAHKKLIPIAKDPDFLALSATTILYAISVAVFAPDYISGVLPYVMKLYIDQKNFAIAWPPLFLQTVIIAVFLLFEGFWSSLKDKTKQTGILLYMSALLCLIPYAVQMKGFYYHMLPALGFFYAGLALTIHGYAWQSLRRPLSRLVVTAALMLGLAYADKPPLLKYPTHNDYKTMPLSVTLEKHCPAPCSFFMFHNSIEIPWQTAIYTNSTIASRFATLWFLPAIYLKRNLTDKDAAELKESFASMLADDFNRLRPKIMILTTNLYFNPDSPVNLIDYFSDNKDFRQAIAPYKKIDAITINQRDYLRGTKLDYDLPLAYDIYERQGIQ